MPKPLISVIVPVYNVKGYLTECVESLLAQTFDSYEILLIDDGSTDGSSTLCESFKTSHPNVRIFHKPNGGLSSARNFGLYRAKADFVAFVDSDDTVEPNYLQSLHDALEKHDADIAVCGYDSDLPRAETLSGKNATIRLLTKQENLDVLAWNKLYKKSLFFDHDIFYPEGEVHEDNLTTYKLYSKAKKVTFVPNRFIIIVGAKTVSRTDSPRNGTSNFANAPRLKLSTISLMTKNSNPPPSFRSF